MVDVNRGGPMENHPRRGPDMPQPNMGGGAMPPMPAPGYTGGQPPLMRNRGIYYALIFFIEHF